MKQKSKQKRETLGWNAKESLEQLIELSKVKKAIVDEIKNTPQWGDTAGKFMGLQRNLQTVDEQIDQVHELYNLHISESLLFESKRLNTLTTFLIILTTILGGLTIIDILSRVIK